MKSLEYNVIITTVTENVEIYVNKGCNAVTVRNIGDVAFIFNGITLQPPPGVGLSGESVSFEGSTGEVYTGRIQISFLVAGLNPLAEISQKFYIENNL